MGFVPIASSQTSAHRRVSHTRGCTEHSWHRTREASRLPTALPRQSGVAETCAGYTVQDVPG